MLPSRPGWLSFRNGEYGHAHELLRRAHELVRRGSMRLETAEVLTALALTALALTEQKLGSIDAATQHLAEARRILEQCPDPRHLLADPRQVRLPSDTPASSAAPANLSHREEVLGLVAQGLTTREIADRLGLSPHTVGAHLRSIYRKINVKTRAAATRYAIAHHLAPPPDTPPA